MKSFILASSLVLCSCGSDNPEGAFWERDAFRALPVPTQIVVSLHWPLIIISVGLCIVAGRDKS